jgi:hypothetical protein
MIRTNYPPQPLQFSPFKLALQQAFQTNRWLTVFGMLSAVLILITAGLAMVDGRLVTGAPVWYKPLKFALSLTINSFTLLWLLQFVQGRNRWVAIAANTVAIASLIELAIITGQALRGVGSHFNVATPLDGILFGMMGLFVNFLWAGMLIVAVLLMRQRFQQPVFAWALRLGMVITLTSSIITGYMMTSAPGIQDETGRTIYAGSHSVGVQDGGEGLPFLGWSTEGGDLRPPHFFGLHAIQVLALLGGVLALGRWPQLRNGHLVALIWSAAVGYGGFVVLATWQALRGEPLIYPSTLTLGVLAALAMTITTSMAGIVWHAHTR